MHQQREPGRDQRVQPLQHAELEQPRRHLRRPHQRRREDRRGGGRARHFQEPRQMRRHRAGDKPDCAENKSQHRHSIRRRRNGRRRGDAPRKGGG